MAGEQKAGIAETVPADLKEDLKEDLVKENTVMQDWKIIQPALFFFLAHIPQVEYNEIKISEKL